MRLIDADALHEALMTKQKWVVRCGDKHNEGYTYDQVHFAIDEAPTIEAVSIDDYRSMENTCYKLQKALYDMADRKTENSSEKPNNSTISKMEQVDKDINVRSKTELKTQTETQNSNLTFEKRTMRDCYNCKRYETEGECIECNYEPKDEPQTEKGGCTNCDGKDLCNNAFTEISQYCGAYEPQNGYQTFNGTSVYVSRLEDEPQIDCSWK